MELKQAQEIAGKAVAQLVPHCQRIEVAGSIRRRRPVVNDIDLVLIPHDLAIWAVYGLLRTWGRGRRGTFGRKVARVEMELIKLDVYFATEVTWATLLLIRTGSKESNVRLARAAKHRGWRLAASGDGLFNEDNERIAGDSEASIFDALGLPYLEPWERD